MHDLFIEMGMKSDAQFYNDEDGQALNSFDRPPKNKRIPMSDKKPKK